MSRSEQALSRAKSQDEQSTARSTTAEPGLPACLRQPPPLCWPAAPPAARGSGQHAPLDGERRHRVIHTSHAHAHTYMRGQGAHPAAYKRSNGTATERQRHWRRSGNVSARRWHSARPGLLWARVLPERATGSPGEFPYAITAPTAVVPPPPPRGVSAAALLRLPVCVEGRFFGTGGQDSIGSVEHPRLGSLD